MKGDFLIPGQFLKRCNADKSIFIKQRFSNHRSGLGESPCTFILYQTGECFGTTEVSQDDGTTKIIIRSRF